MTARVVERTTLGVVLDRHHDGQGWSGPRWSVVDVLPGRVDVPAWTSIAEQTGWRRYYAGPVILELFAGAAAEYWRNLASSRPALYVILRRDRAEPGVRLLGATVDPGEVEVHANSGDDLIEALPLPPFLAAWLWSFVDRHYVERPLHRRQRDRADLDVLGQRARVPELRAMTESLLRRWSRRKLEAVARAEVSRDAAEVASRDAARGAGRRGTPSCRRRDPRAPTATTARSSPVRSRRSFAKRALRQAWSTDPKIAGFRGFADYDWDCNAPGYAALLPVDDIARLCDAVLRRAGPGEAVRTRCRRTTRIPPPTDLAEQDGRA